MSNFKTKDDLIRKFGIPTSKRSDGDYEEWYYLFGVKTVVDKNASLKGLLGSSSSQRSSSSASGSGMGTSGSGFSTGMASSTSSGFSNSTSVSGVNASGSAKSVSQEVKSFVKFTLKGDEVIGWDSNDVDYGIYEWQEIPKKKKEKEEKVKVKDEKDKKGKKNK